MDLLALAEKWEADAEVIEQATHGGESGKKPLPKVRRGLAAEVLRACARDLRSTFQESGDSLTATEPPADARCDCDGWGVDCSCDFVRP